MPPRSDQPLQFRKIADDAVGQKDDDDDQQDAEKRLVGRAQRRDRADHFGEQDHDDRADRRPPVRGHAADHNDHDRDDRNVVERENDLSVDITHVVRVKDAGEAREHGGEHKRRVLVARRVDAERFGGVLVLADGDEVIAEFRLNDLFHDEEGYPGDQEDDVVVPGLLDPGPLADHDAQVSSGETHHVLRDDPEDDAHRQGGQREERPPQPETDVSDDQREGGYDDDADRQPPPPRDAQLAVKHPRGIGAGSEERGMSEGHLPAVSGEKVPGHADHGPHDDDNENVHHVGAGTGKREQREEAQNYVRYIFFHKRHMRHTSLSSPNASIGDPLSIIKTGFGSFYCSYFETAHNQRPKQLSK